MIYVPGEFFVREDDGWRTRNGATMKSPKYHVKQDKARQSANTRWVIA